MLFIDTAGIDDVGALGQMRVERTRQVFDRTDIGVVVAAGEWSEFEEEILGELLAARGPGRGRPEQDRPGRAAGGRRRASCAERKVRLVRTDRHAGEGIADLRQALLDSAPDELRSTIRPL